MTKNLLETRWVFSSRWNELFFIHSKDRTKIEKPSKQKYILRHNMLKVYTYMYVKISTHPDVPRGQCFYRNLASLWICKLALIHELCENCLWNMQRKPFQRKGMEVVLQERCLWTVKKIVFITFIFFVDQVHKKFFLSVFLVRSILQAMRVGGRL